MQASGLRALLRMQGVVSEQHNPYASSLMRHATEQRALPSQAGRSGLAVHPTRVGDCEAGI